MTGKTHPSFWELEDDQGYFSQQLCCDCEHLYFELRSYLAKRSESNPVLNSNRLCFLSEEISYPFIFLDLLLSPCVLRYELPRGVYTTDWDYHRFQREATCKNLYTAHMRRLIASTFIYRSFQNTINVVLLNTRLYTYKAVRGVLFFWFWEWSSAISVAIPPPLTVILLICF